TGGPAHPDGDRRRRAGRVPGQRARLAGLRARTPAVDRLRSLSNLQWDHDFARTRGDLHCVHAPLRRPDRAHDLDGASDRRQTGRGPVDRRTGGYRVSLPALIAILLGLSLTAYALFAGADFGGGILDLLAKRRDAERNA